MVIFQNVHVLIIIQTLLSNPLLVFELNQITGFNQSNVEEMRLIPKGCFLMGTKNGDEDEQPSHEVCLESFYIDIFEVTQKKYGKVIGKNPSVFKGDNLPVEDVTWYEAGKYCKVMGKRLPTEADFEYSARGGTMTNYYWGNEIGISHANCDGCGSHWDGRGTAPVGSFQPNGYGLYDILGNVWEWTSDWYGEKYYANSPKDNPNGPDGKSEKKVLRGGSWDSLPDSLRTSYRYAHYPSVRYDSGFRCVK